MSLAEASSSEWSAVADHIATRRQVPGFVLLSFLVSYLGSLTTLELIDRKTSMRGRHNWFFHLAASLSMGGVSIWSMHIIGNRAITLDNGEAELQIAYSTGLTTLSFFLPIILLFFAFTAVGINDEISYYRLVLGGTITGLGVCGMHYLGQASITNYQCMYTIANVVAAAFIAVLASIVALVVFFVFRSAWSALWWKRAICALILASAVSGMHWTASVGTAYRLKTGSIGPNPNVRNVMTIMVIVLSMGSCIIYLLLIGFIAQALRIQAASRAHEVVLATAIFDKGGKLLVTPGGTVPNQKITSSYLEQTFSGTFSIAHPSFHWMFRTTRNWSGVKGLIMPMKTHLQLSGLKIRFGAEADSDFVNEHGTPIKDYHLIFRELFCAAAADLAEELHQPLDGVGVMYDEIMYTGSGTRFQHHLSRTARAQAFDVEHHVLGLENLGKGQLLFLVREVERQEAERLQASGYRFALPANVLPILAAAFHVTGSYLMRQLENMREYVVNDHILNPGVHLAFFAVKAAIESGFVIVARKDAKNQLPTVQLPFGVLESWQLDHLRNMEGFDVIACLRHLNKTSQNVASTDMERLFAFQLLTCIEALRNQIDDPIFNDACLIATPVYAPCRGPTKDSCPGKATLIAFNLIIPVGSRAPGTNLGFVPLSFFEMQQHVYTNSADHIIFARKTLREFSNVLDLTSRPNNIVPIKKRRRSSDITKMMGEKSNFGGAVSRLVGDVNGANITEALSSKGEVQTNARNKGEITSESNLVEHLLSETHSQGPIMVIQEVNADSKVKDRPSTPTSMNVKDQASFKMAGLKSLHWTTLASDASQEEEEEEQSYVDKLLKLCIQSRR